MTHMLECQRSWRESEQPMQPGVRAASSTQNIISKKEEFELTHM